MIQGLRFYIWNNVTVCHNVDFCVKVQLIRPCMETWGVVYDINSPFNC